MAKLTGSITKIKNGKYLVRVQTNKDGVRKSKSKIIYGSRDDANTYRDDLIEAAKKLRKEPKRDYKNCNDLFDAYLKIIKPNIAPQTLVLYERLIKSYLRPKFGSVSLLEIDSYSIENYYASLQKSLSPVTIQKIHTQFKAALGKARSWRWIDYNPCADIRPPKIVRTKKDVLTFEEINRFLNACPDERTRTLWAFFAVTGARSGEVCAARWQDIKDGVWRVSQALIQTKGVTRFDVPKTAQSVRFIPLPETMLAALKKHKVEQNKERLKLGVKWSDLDLIFPTNTGKPQRLSNIGMKCTKIKEDAGITKTVSPHLFRHSFSSLAMKSGLNPKVVADLLGHSTPVMTLQSYTHTDAEQRRIAAEEVTRNIKFG